MRSLLAVIAVVAVACGGGKGSGDDTTPPPAGGGDAGSGDQTAAADAGADEPLDYQAIELGSPQEIVPLLKVGAEALGCTLIGEKPEPPAVAYQCEKATLFMAQVGTTLRYTCEHVTDEECTALLRSVNEKVLEAAGGKNE